VRIALDPKELQAHPLRIGLSMAVEVDTHDRKGSQLGGAQTSSFQTSVFDNDGKEADADIAGIIARNQAAN
jgi:membrane fusion protein (multidrug efflux system)